MNAIVEATPHPVCLCVALCSLIRYLLVCEMSLSCRLLAVADADLVSSMAGRLAMVERELLAAKREIIEKDEKIAHLAEKVSILSRSSREGEGESVIRELKQKCLEYQKQIADMEVRGL